MKKVNRALLISAAALFMFSACKGTTDNPVTPPQPETPVVNPETPVPEDPVSPDPENPAPEEPDSPAPETPAPDNPDPVPDDPVTPPAGNEKEEPEETVPLYGNWEYSDEGSYTTYYFDENGTYYSTRKTLSTNTTLSTKGTFELTSSTTMNNTIVEICSSKTPFTILDILNYESNSNGEEFNDYVWTLYEGSNPTTVLDYKIENKKLILTISKEQLGAEEDYTIELTRAEIQPTSLHTKRLVSSDGVREYYSFDENGNFEEKTLTAEGKGTVTGKYVFNELNKTLLLKPEKKIYPDGTEVLKGTPGSENQLYDIYMDYCTDKSMIVFFQTIHLNNNTYQLCSVNAFVDPEISYPFSNKLYEAADGSKFISTGDYATIYLSTLDVSGTYNVEFENNTIKLRYSYNVPYTYDGFYFNYEPQEDGKIKVTSKIGPNQTLQDLYNSDGVISFVYNQGQADSIQLIPFSHKIKTGVNSYSYTIQNNTIFIPGLGFSGTYEEHFDADVPYFSIGEDKFYYAPLEYVFSENENITLY